MLFSAKQFHSFLVAHGSDYANDNALRLIGRGYEHRLPTLKECGAIMRRAREALASRNGSTIYNLGLTKWYRPWHVVPELKSFHVPEGDYSIGIEVEYGFQTEQAAADIANVIKNWRYITMDSEGGRNGMEVTFAPTLYSKFGASSQACRYLKLLKKNASSLIHHSPSMLVGTHVNLSFAGFRDTDRSLYQRLRRINMYMDTRNGWMYESSAGTTPLTRDQQFKYFGREPYQGMNFQTTHIEFKLFDSVYDWKKLRKYVNIAVSLTELMRSEEEITRDTVIAALERGYNKA